MVNLHNGSELNHILWYSLSSSARYRWWESRLYHSAALYNGGCIVTYLSLSYKDEITVPTLGRLGSLVS